MNRTTQGRVLLSLGLLAAAVTSAVAPAFSLDYEAKPVKRVIQAPFRLMGGLTGAIVSGGFSGPVDDGFHLAKKGTRHLAGEFGDEHGTGQILAAAPVSGSAGMVLGGAYGVPHGFMHGFQTGWDKPFSRWSYITKEEVITRVRALPNLIVTR